MEIAKLKAKKRFTLQCEAQGIAKKDLDTNQLLEWLVVEQAYWSDYDTLAEIYDPSVGGIGVDLRTNYIHRLSEISSDVRSGKGESLQDFLVEAAQFRAIIGQGRLGEALSKLRQRNESGSGRVACALSPWAVGNLSHSTTRMLESDRSILMLSPALIEATGLVSVQSREEQSKWASEELLAEAEEMHKKWSAVEAHIETTTSDLETWRNGIIEKMDALHDLYHNKMQTEAAATYWQKKARASRWIAYPALALFVALIIAPLWFGYLHFVDIKAVLVELTQASADKFSLTPLVAITVPVLGYAWMLRQVSRLFIGNMALADDASHRKVMAMTFLGLAKDPQSGVTDAERAIILSALFRSAPSNIPDDGPPVGLLDILRKP